MMAIVEWVEVKLHALINSGLPTRTRATYDANVNSDTLMGIVHHHGYTTDSPPLRGIALPTPSSFMMINQLDC